MTIDKAINRLENYYDTFCGYNDDGLCGAIYTAISTMRKYQKIQKIVKSWEGDSWTDDISEDCMEKISEVMEDGKA